MTALADFLFARIAEDEALARDGGADAMTGAFWKQLEPDAYDEIQALALKHSRRVLAECEAKRRVVEALACDLARDPDAANCDGDGAPWLAHRVARSLAAVYADHPDYQDAWRP